MNNRVNTISDSTPVAPSLKAAAPLALALALGAYSDQAKASTCSYSFDAATVVPGADTSDHEAWPTKSGDGLMFTRTDLTNFDQKFITDGATVASDVNLTGMPSGNYMAQFESDSSVFLKRVTNTDLYVGTDTSGGAWSSGSASLDSAVGYYGYDQVAGTFTYAPYNGVTEQYDVEDEDGNVLMENAYEPGPDTGSGRNRTFYVTNCDASGLNDCEVWVVDNDSGCTQQIDTEARSPYYDQATNTLYYAAKVGGVSDYDIVSKRETFGSAPTDSDGDGVEDNSDAFPADPLESSDNDGDGTGDNADAFDFDPTETTDTDSDGTGDNSDAFPEDASESQDSDNDGVGDNSDAFPEDPDETTDTDGDGMGDSSDPYPEDPTNTPPEECDEAAQAAPAELCGVEGGSADVTEGTVEVTEDGTIVMSEVPTALFVESNEGESVDVKVQLDESQAIIPAEVYGTAGIELCIEAPSGFAPPPNATTQDVYAQITVDTGYVMFNGERIEADGLTHFVKVGTITVEEPDTGDTGTPDDTGLDSGSPDDTAIDTANRPDDTAAVSDTDGPEVHLDTPQDPTGCACASTGVPSGAMAVVGFAAMLAVSRRRQRDQRESAQNAFLVDTNNNERI